MSQNSWQDQGIVNIKKKHFKRFYCLITVERTIINMGNKCVFMSCNSIKNWQLPREPRVRMSQRSHMNTVLKHYGAFVVCTWISRWGSGNSYIKFLMSLWGLFSLNESFFHVSLIFISQASPCIFHKAEGFI